jgi:hypothetical protein
MMVAVVYAKGRCFQHIVSMMPPHAVYIEAFLGGGAVLRNKLPAEWSIGIDLDPAVASLWERESVEGVEIVNGDAIDFLLTYQFEGDELVYCDPPYLQETRRKKRIYRYEYDRLQHELLLDTLLKTPCRVMLSGYRSRLPEAAEATLLPNAIFYREEADQASDTAGSPEPAALRQGRAIRPAALSGLQNAPHKRRAEILPSLRDAAGRRFHVHSADEASDTCQPLKAMFARSSPK